MKFATILITLLAATAAHAHPGHMAEVAGHRHWLGAAALGAAIAIGLWAGLRARKNAQPSGEEAGDAAADDDLQEA